MRVNNSRIIKGKLILETDDGETSLPDGIYRKSEGESLTIQDQRVVAVSLPIDLDRATKDDLQRHIRDIEEQLSRSGTEAQLANLELQNMLQKQQQLIQTISNVSKQLHDTAMAVVRKMG